MPLLNDAPSPQAIRFLERLLAMNVSSQQSFRRIYALAPHTKAKSPEPLPESEKTQLFGYPVAVGRHVRAAMLESISHPQVAEWVRMNLALRIGLKLAQTTQQNVRAQRLEAVLEAFHIAADAFIEGIPLLDAQAMREHQASQGDRKPSYLRETALPWKDGVPVDKRLAEEIQAIAQFKRQIIPGLAQKIRRQSG